MEIGLRGWGRNMGTKKVLDVDLSGLTLSRDPQKSVYFHQPGIFKSIGEVSVAWGGDFHLTGSYRVQVDFTRNDAAKIFKSMFGSEITQELLDEYGLTISPELQKSLIGKIKLADLTIADLAGLSTAKPEPKAQEQRTPAPVKPLLRRI